MLTKSCNDCIITLVVKKIKKSGGKKMFKSVRKIFTVVLAAMFVFALPVAANAGEYVIKEQWGRAVAFVDTEPVSIERDTFVAAVRPANEWSDEAVFTYDFTVVTVNVGTTVTATGGINAGGDLHHYAMTLHRIDSIDPGAWWRNLSVRDIEIMEGLFPGLAFHGYWDGSEVEMELVTIFAEARRRQSSEIQDFEIQGLIDYDNMGWDEMFPFMYALEGDWNNDRPMANATYQFNETGMFVLSTLETIGWPGADYRIFFNVIDGAPQAPPTPPARPGDAVGVTINGAELNSEVPPQLIDGRTMLPLRAIGEALGMEVGFDGATQTATLTAPNINITHVVHTSQISVNGVVQNFDVPSTIIDGRTLVPVRMLAEAIGANVDWDAETRTAVITN
jgi:hypothetical protein